MQQGLPGDGRGEPLGLAAHGAVFAVWLTGASALACYASGDRYSGYYVLWTGVLLAVGLVVPLGALGAAAPHARRLAPSVALAAAYCVVFAGALSLDVSPGLRVGARLGAARLLLLGASIALAAWNLKRARISRLGLGAAMALLCLAWMLCGLLLAEGVPQAVSRASILLPLAAAVAILLPGLPRLDPIMSRFRQWATLAACAALVLLPLTRRVPMPAVLTAPAAGSPPGGRSALLIVLDTLRRDHMSLYGYERQTTPAIDRWASRGLVFDESTSVAGWTLPTHASMFTGLWPRSHGAHAFRRDDGSVVVHPLPQERVTLAEIARDHGYRTAGLTANHLYMSPRWGVGQGFEQYLCRRPRLSGLVLGSARGLARRWDKRRAQYAEMPYLTAPEMTRAAIAWLERHRERPFFLFVNYMDAHVPNAAPGSQGLEFADEIVSVAAEKHQMHRSYLSGADISAAEQRSIVNEYDREVIHLDRWVGELLGYLDGSGLSATTLVVLTSDHGEFLGEHHLLGHGKDLFAEGVDVPLVVRQPGEAPGRVSRPVQSHDLFPTILRYLELPIPEGIQGQPLLEANHATVCELYYVLDQWLLRGPFRQRFDRVLRTIRAGEHRYFKSSNGEERLFDIADDPGEARNLVSERPGLVASARARLEAWLAEVPEAPAPLEPPETLDAEALESLRTLGYVR